MKRLETTIFDFPIHNNAQCTGSKLHSYYYLLGKSLDFKKVLLGWGWSTPRCTGLACAGLVSAARSSGVVGAGQGGPEVPKEEVRLLAWVQAVPCRCGVAED